VWALALALAANWTTNPLILALIAAAATLTVATKKAADQSGWATYWVLAALVFTLRIAYRILFAGYEPGRVLWALPEFHGPGPFRALTILGPLTAEGLYQGFCDGLRLATMILAVGAAGCLADPRRLLAAAPKALKEAGTVLVIAISVLPQLGQSVHRVRRAQKLRPAPGRGPHPIRAIALPVLADALDRSLALAAAMESRGHGHADPLTRRQRLAAVTAATAGLCLLAAGSFAVISAAARQAAGWAVLAAGLAFLMLAMRIFGRRVTATTYRPTPARPADWTLALAGLAAPAALALAGLADPASVLPAIRPLTPPPLPTLAFLGVALATTAALTCAPTPRRPVVTSPGRRLAPTPPGGDRP